MAKMKPKPVPVEEPTDPQAKWWEEDADRVNELGAYMQKMGYQVPRTESKHGVEEAVAYLHQMPPDRAVTQAREWTGRTDINTLAEAIAAVRESGQQPNGTNQQGDGTGGTET